MSLPIIPEDQVHKLTGLGESLFPDRYAIHPEETWEEASRRWARGGAAAEHGEGIHKWEGRFYTEIVTNKFIPGGRIMRSLGRPLQATGNCVAGDTIIQTKEGLFQARSLANRTIHTLSNGGIYRTAKWSSYGIQELWNITLKNGDTFRATKDHEWVTIAKKGKREVVTTEYLEGRTIPIQHRIEEITYDEEDYLDGVRWGLVYGDGSLHHPAKQTSYLQQFADSKELVYRYFDNAKESNSKPCSVANGQPGYYKTKLPAIDDSESRIRGFIAGIIAADGCVDSRGHTMLHQADKTMLKAVRMLAASVGIPTTPPKMTRTLNPWTGAPAPLWKITFIKAAMYNDRMILKTSHREKMFSSPKPGRKTTSVRVTEVKPLGIHEEVFCCVEPETHTMVIGCGYLTKQCFVIGPDHFDSREGWGEAVKEVIIISGLGGGVGLNGSEIRPRGTPVGRTGGEATGAVSFFEILNAAAGVIRGGGGRRAALMLCLNHDHPDLEEFLNKKLNLDELKNANVSLGFLNESIEDFIVKVQNNEDHELVWHDSVIKTVKAKDIWDTVIHNSLKAAEPGALNLHLMNKMNNLYYCREITCSNPCVTGDTRVSTSRGLVQIKDLVRTSAPIYTMGKKNPKHDINYRFPGIVVDPRMGQDTPQKMENCFVSGEKQVFRLKTKEGYSLKLTANHRIMTTKGWKQADELKPGDSIHIQNTHGGFGSEGHWNLGIVAGWLTGDGTLVGNKKDVPRLYCYPPDKDVFPILLKAVTNIIGQSPAWYLPTDKTDWERAKKAHIECALLREHLGELCQNKFRIPEFVWQGTRGVQEGYISALFSADGSVQGTKEKGFSIRLASSHLALLEDVQRLLLNFNVFSKIYAERRPEGWRKLPDGYGGYKSYYCNADHELVVSRSSMVTFKNEIKLIREDKQELLEENIATYTKGPYAESFTAEFTELEALGVEMVFDLSEPTTRSFCANGLVVHNCGEIGLEPYGMCNLGCLVLPRFVNKNGTDLQWGKLNTTITTAVRFLDNMIDVGHYPFPKIKKEMTDTRRLGLGITGLHTMLLQLGMKYDSEEAYAFVHKMMKFIKHKAYEASIFLAVEKGQFPLMDRDQFVKSGFCKTLKPSIRDKIEEYGMRNCAVLTVPPHGTGSIICNVTSGIEAMFAPACQRTYQDGEETKTTIVFDPMAEKLLAEGGDASILQGALDVPPKNHMRMQALIQQHVDNAISKTIWLPKGYTEEELSELFMEYLPQVKGVTVYTTGSRPDEPLTPIPFEEALTLGCKDGACEI